ncbi:MAG: N-acyl homoserine lactonase family protein, partial [Burkholderiaceae bacterium]
YRQFSIAFHVGEMMASFDRLKKIAPSPQHIIPGHDPLVMTRYPTVAETDGLIVRLDEAPSV